MGVFSGMVGVYLSERTERIRELKELERRVASSLRDSVYWRAARIIPIYIALWSGVGIVTFPTLVALPLLLAAKDLLGLYSAYYTSLGISIVILGGLGAYMGRVSGEGMAWLFVGDVTKGLPGGGFLYTFRDTISLGIVVRLKEASRILGGPRPTLSRRVYELVEDLRLHPRLSRYWRDSDVVEYGAHLTIEDPLSFMPKRLVGDGIVVVGDAAGLLLNTGYTIRGVDLAAYSGKLAADVIEKAFNENDFSRRSLALYERLIKNSFIYKGLVRHSCITEILKDNKLYNTYIEALVDSVSSLYKPESTLMAPKDALLKAFRERNINFIDIVKILLKLFLGC